MPPDLHAELARAAEREGTSLNGFIIASLTATVGGSATERAAEADEAVRIRDGRTVTWLLVANVVAVSLAALAAIVILLVAVL
jgi:hypothetical protein